MEAFLLKLMGVPPSILAVSLLRRTSAWFSSKKEGALWPVNNNLPVPAADVQEGLGLEDVGDDTGL